MRMRRALTAAIGMAFMALSLQAGAADHRDKYEPYRIFTVKRKATTPGGRVLEEKTETHHTTHSLPWGDFGEHDFPPSGFIKEVEAATLQWQGQEIKGEKITLRRDPNKGFGSVPVREIRIWRSDQLETPEFTFMTSSLRWKIPAGTLRVQADPLRAGQDVDSDDPDLEDTYSLEGKLTGETTCELGDEKVNAVAFEADLKGPGRKVNVRFVLSKEVPGQLCEVSGSMRDQGRRSNMKIKLQNVENAPLPEGLQDFPDAGFAYAPPPGYEKTEPENGEFVRYENDSGQSIAVRLVDMPQGLSSYTYPEPEGLEGETDIGPSGRFDIHLGGELTEYFGKMRGSSLLVLALYTLHNGQGYCMRLSGVTYEELAPVIHRWRWMNKGASASKSDSTEEAENGDKAVKALEAKTVQSLGQVQDAKLYQRTWAAGPGKAFTALPDEPGLLCGFDLTCEKVNGREVVTSLRPIFLTAGGRRRGQRYGQPTGTPREIVAKPGYVLGALMVSVADRVEGLRAIFVARKDGAVLDGNDTYKSEWYGSHGGGSARTWVVGSPATPVIGVHGHQGDGLNTLGLIVAPTLREGHKRERPKLAPKEAIWQRVAALMKFARMEDYRPTIHEFRGNYYAMIPIYMRCEVAQEVCRSMGGHLATISDRAEDRFLRDRVLTTQDALIGLRYNGSTGSWEWTTGEPVGYTNWAQGEPNMLPRDDAAIVRVGKAWNNTIGFTHPAICEWEGTEDLGRTGPLNFYSRIDVRAHLPTAYRQSYLSSIKGRQVKGSGWIKEVRSGGQSRRVLVGLYSQKWPETQIIVKIPKTASVNIKTGRRVQFGGTIEAIDVENGPRSGLRFVTLDNAWIR